MYLNLKKSHCLLLLVISLISVSSCYEDLYHNLDHFHTPTLYPPPFYFTNYKQNYYYHKPNSAHRRNYKNPLRASHLVIRPKVVNVDAFGAKADGRDDSKAFKRAWKEACSSTGTVLLVVPKNRDYVLKPITFSGPCRSNLAFKRCFNVKASNVLVTAPEYSPNTDGIHVTETQNILIKNSVIKTGDDCISIVSGSKNVRATGITCGPGHGISIGSLGARNSAAYVSNVVVDKARLSGTTNGVRIKTWQGGSGYAKNIIFQNVVMQNVSNPIIINQYYCDQEKPCPEQHPAVRISNVMYNNIRGSSASEDAIKLSCSKSFPCHGIWLQNIALGRQLLQEDNDQVARASCSNVGLVNRGIVYPRCSSKY
ncbi:hypothetical protein SLEP1_g36658 [Rubroshorea leprosula]|uniref:Polygalacturonase n=1 Tax=Rubroshorea leprosula TaxID=152421 RepID=A0AAV5KS72_9ROSI|nr:hypothetical protein SLEP1_g36658 [Rubroshorea leprosula]